MNIRKLRRRKLLFFVSVLLGFFVLVFFVRNLLVSALLAFVGFYLITPLVDLLERRGMPRITSVLVPFVTLTAVFFLATQWLLPSFVSQFGSLKGDLPRYLEKAQRLSVEIEAQAGHFLPPETAARLTAQVEERLLLWAHRIFEGLPNYVSDSLTVLFLAPFLCFFMLLDGRSLVRQLLAIVPNHYFELVMNLQHEISFQMGGFIRARLLESLIVGVLVAAGLMIMDFKYALVLALFAAVLNLIPYVGPVIGALPAYLLAFLGGATSGEFLALTVIYGGAQVIDAALILPILVAKIVNLHPVTVVLSIMIGSQLMGVLGMIISIPVTSALKVTLSALYQHLTQFRDEI
ncbi:MAG: AI-2E family transporter [Bdellovibrionaceae bacterium]|nr:AI-2E family transporter [Pseudobdellovibrionaceae bacterium]MBX3034135.1 AI-2E family transporter [Pseudobdellovibrionaceae bacterium]